MKQKNSLKSLDTFVDEQYGLKGTPKRDEFEKGRGRLESRVLVQARRFEALGAKSAKSLIEAPAEAEAAADPSVQV